MTNQEILANAPKGATHYDDGLYYRMWGSNLEWYDEEINEWEID